MEEIKKPQNNSDNISPIYEIIFELHKELGEIENKQSVVKSKLEYLEKIIQKHDKYITELVITKNLHMKVIKWLYKFGFPLIGILLAIGGTLYEIKKHII